MRKNATGKHAITPGLLLQSEIMWELSPFPHMCAAKADIKLSHSGGDNRGDWRVRGNLCIHFTRVRSVNPNVLQVYFFHQLGSFFFLLLLYWTFNPCPPRWKSALTLTTAASIPSINTLSLHHLINSYRAAGATPLYLDTGRKWAGKRGTGPVIICSLSEVSVATARETHPEAVEPSRRAGGRRLKRPVAAIKTLISI